MRPIAYPMKTAANPMIHPNKKNIVLSPGQKEARTGGDEEADRIYEQVDEAMDARRKVRRWVSFLWLVSSFSVR